MGNNIETTITEIDLMKQKVNIIEGVVIQDKNNDNKMAAQRLQSLTF